MADFHGAVIGRVNEIYRTRYTRDMVTGWDLGSFMDPAHARAVWTENVFHDPFLTLDMEPVRSAVFAVLLLKYLGGHEPWIVTDRPGCLWNATRSWLDERGLAEVPMVFAAELGLTKCEVAQQLGLQVAVEDAPHNVERLAKVCDTVYVMDYPYNRDLDIAPEFADRVVRVGGWGEVRF